MQERKRPGLKRPKPLLGPLATYVTLVKGMIGTGVLYTPHMFVTSGWGFSLFSMLICAFLTFKSGIMLLEVNAKLKTTSFSETSIAVLGKHGKTISRIMITGSQLGFAIAFMYFKIRTIHDLFKFEVGVEVPRSLIALVWFLLLAGLSLVRKIDIFAATHVFGNIMMVTAFISLFYYGSWDLKTKGNHWNEVDFIYPSQFSAVLGSAIFSFEGIGLLMPVQNLTEDKEDFKRIFKNVMITCAALYSGIGLFAVLVWGDGTQQLVMENLPLNGFTWAIKVLYCLNLMFTFPLQLYPINTMIEDHLFKEWPKSRKRQASKNLTRTLLVALTALACLSLGNKGDKFVSLAGAVTCTPVAFLLPALFHFKTCAVTQKQRIIDISLIILSGVILVFTTTLCLITW
jgi:proton-coupled amino acid transporter